MVDIAALVYDYFLRMFNILLSFKNRLSLSGSYMR